MIEWRHLSTVIYVLRRLLMMDVDRDLDARDSGHLKTETGGKESMLSLMLSLMSAVAALAAAIYWFRSSRVIYPASISGSVPHGGGAYIDARPIADAASKSGRLNKIAAGYSAFAAFAAALSSVISLL